MSRKKREREKMPFIVATYVYASSQGQRTHFARTKNLTNNSNTVSYETRDCEEGEQPVAQVLVAGGDVGGQANEHKVKEKAVHDSAYLLCWKQTSSGSITSTSSIPCGCHMVLTQNCLHFSIFSIFWQRSDWEQFSPEEQGTCCRKEYKVEQFWRSKLCLDCRSFLSD